MPAITVPNTTRVTLNGGWSNGRVIDTVLDFNDSGAASASDIADDVIAAWQGAVVVDLPDNYTVFGATYMELSSGGSVGTVPPNSGTSNVGGSTSATPGPNTSVLVNKNIAARERGERNGRLYLPPPPETEMTEDGFLNPSYRSGVQTNMDTFFAGVATAGGGAGLVVVHVIGGASSGTATAVGSLTVQALTATQRRRLRG